MNKKILGTIVGGLAGIGAGELTRRYAVKAPFVSGVGIATDSVGALIGGGAGYFIGGKF